ncbi:hypothetical protein JB92DRAFT_2836452 [Gautieria morchelliformis]|nr:hypothetical protein JB92DRAFT_2836452 [Gautieria morchelliformis]
MPSRSSKSSQSTRRSSRVRPPLPGEVNVMMVDVMPTPHQPYVTVACGGDDTCVKSHCVCEDAPFANLRRPHGLDPGRWICRHSKRPSAVPPPHLPTPQQSNDLQDAVQLAARVVLDAIKSPAPGLRGDRTWGGGSVGQAAADGLYDGDGERGEIGVLWLARAV